VVARRIPDGATESAVAYRLEADVAWLTGTSPTRDDRGRASWSVSVWSLGGGEAAGVDVSGLLLVEVTHDPGVARDGGRALFVDERAAPDQVEVLVDCFGGRMGGPLSRPSGGTFGFYQLPVDQDGGVVVVRGRLRLEVVPDPGVAADVTPLVGGVRLPAIEPWAPAAAELWANIPELGLVWRQRGCAAVLGRVVLVG
jgi:hypothetical protein